MKLQAHDDAQSFLDAANVLLGRDEARHNLVFGICSTLLEAPDTYSTSCLWTVERGGVVVWAGLMTPPFNLVIARPTEPEALRFAARALHDQDVKLPGVTGAIPEVDAFAEVWEHLTGLRRRVRMAQGIYAVERPRPPAGVPGTLRFATPSDRELILQCMHDFRTEAVPAGSPAIDLERVVDHRLAPGGPGGFALWEDRGEVVSMSGYGGGTPNGTRIDAVYTPPIFRRRGYAGALVADLSTRLLAEGLSYCFLYTDLANATANHVYAQVGYELVCESADYAFEAAEPARP